MSQPTNRITVHLPAARGTRYAPDAFDASIGQEISVKTPTSPAVMGTLVAARVVENGAAVELTLDVPDSVSQALR